MSENPWWRPGEADLHWNELLPAIIRLAPDYSAELPLWGEGFGNISWQFTKFPPELLDRLAVWQREFEDNYDSLTGWRSVAIRDHWTNTVEDLAADLRAELGTRAQLVVDLWPLEEDVRSKPV